MDPKAVCNDTNWITVQIELEEIAIKVYGMA